MVSYAVKRNQIAISTKRTVTSGVLFLFVILLAFTNLTGYPQPWFDEGSHLHVPKALTKYGVYADYSSEGFRYYGPTIGVGPTVMLPIAAVFKIFGIGLLQARIVMALYLIAAIYVFYRMTLQLSNYPVALLACALLISSRAAFLLYYGRQLLGEVPGLFFMVLGIWLWFTYWEDINWKRLSIIGILFGLAMITKYQYLLFLFPMIGIAWLLNLIYYRTTSHKQFILPALVAGFVFGIWQIITIRYLGPATMIENLDLLRASAETAAFSLDPKRIIENLVDLKSRSAYLVALFPSIVYGFFISLPRDRESQKWCILYIIVVLNLGWFVLASIGWIRYAFLGLAFSSVFTARFFYEATDSFTLEYAGNKVSSLWQNIINPKNAFRLALMAWLAMIILVPMAINLAEILFPGADTSGDMSAYLNENVPMNSLIETWEPEMGFLTDHNYHYPHNHLLAHAIDQVYYSRGYVKDLYDYVQTETPEYLLVGDFAKRVEMYPMDEFEELYQLVYSAGNYDLYKKIE